MIGNLEISLTYNGVKKERSRDPYPSPRVWLSVSGLAQIPTMSPQKTLKPSQSPLTTKKSVVTRHGGLESKAQWSSYLPLVVWLPVSSLVPSGFWHLSEEILHGNMISSCGISYGTIASRTLFGCLGSLLCLQVLSLSVAGQPSSLFQHQIYRWIHSFNKRHQQIKHGVPPSAQFLFTPTPFALDIEAPVKLSERSAAAKSLQSCPTLCDPIDGSPPGSPIPGILQARTLEWVAISFSNAGKWKVKGKSLSRVWLLATPWTTAYQAPPSMGFSRQEYWSGVPLPSLQKDLASPNPKFSGTVHCILVLTDACSFK